VSADVDGQRSVITREPSVEDTCLPNSSPSSARLRTLRTFYRPRPLVVCLDDLAPGRSGMPGPA
jgi:hypothetical protein